MKNYSVWSGDVWMGEYKAESADEAIAAAVKDGGGNEIEYDAMQMD